MMDLTQASNFIPDCKHQDNYMPVITQTRPYPWDPDKPKVGGFIDFRIYCMDCKCYFEKSIEWHDERRLSYQLVVERYDDCLRVTLYLLQHDGSSRSAWHETYYMPLIQWRKVECVSSV